MDGHSQFADVGVHRIASFLVDRPFVIGVVLINLAIVHLGRIFPVAHKARQPCRVGGQQFEVARIEYARPDEAVGIILVLTYRRSAFHKPAARRGITDHVQHIGWVWHVDIHEDDAVYIVDLRSIGHRVALHNAELRSCARIQGGKKSKYCQYDEYLFHCLINLTISAPICRI